MKLWFIPLLLCLAGKAMAVPTPDDFAGGFQLQVLDGGAIYAVEVPEELYRTVVNEDLADVAVFNAAKELVPHSIQAVRKVEPAGERHNIPLFPLYSQNMSHGGDLSLRVKRGPAGDILEVKSMPLDGREVLAGYLLDISAFPQPFSRLEFSWEQEEQGVISKIILESSSDLLHWRTEVARGILAELRFRGQLIRQNSIEIPRVSAKYLRVHWAPDSSALMLHEVAGVLHSTKNDWGLHWLPAIVPDRVETGEQTELFYLLDYRVAVSAMKISFPQENSLATLALYSRRNDEQQWHKQCEKSLYHLRVEELIAEDTLCRFPPVTDSQWRLQVKEDGAAFGNAKWPAIAFGYQPRDLVFVGRGSPPFLLAYGSGKPVAELKQYTTDIASVAGKQGDVMYDSALVRRAKVGERVVLGGNAALVPPPVPMPWRTWLLWLILLGGVAILVIMSRSLMREMRKTSES